MCTRSERSAMRLSSERRLLTLADLDLRHSQRENIYCGLASACLPEPTTLVNGLNVILSSITAEWGRQRYILCRQKSRSVEIRLRRTFAGPAAVSSNQVSNCSL